MEPRINRATDGPEYENFEPKTEVISGDDKETLVIYLPGFNPSQLGVELTPNRLFKVSGELQVANNKWSWFAMEYPASANGDLSKASVVFENEALHIIQPKLIAKVADKEKPAGAESKLPAPPKSAEKPANVEAQTQPKQKEEGSNNERRVIPGVHLISDEKCGIELPPRHPKPRVAKRGSRKKPLEDHPLKREEESKMKGTVAEDDGAVVGKARETSDDQKHGNGNRNSNSLARTGGWTKTLMKMTGSKPRMVVSIVLVVVVALLLGPLHYKLSHACQQ